MNKGQRPKQIYLTDALLYCLEKWRWIIVFMLFAALIAGGRTYLFTVKENQTMQEVQAEAQKTDTDDTEEKQVQSPIESYMKSVEELERDLEIQENYLENSVVMQIEPYHISTGTLSYYIEGGEYTDSLMEAYNSFISSGRMAESLYVQDSDIPVEDLRYLISFSNNMTEGTKQSAVFQIQIKMPDGSQGEVYLKHAEEIISQYTSQLRSEMSEHKMTLLSTVQSEMADLEIQRYQSSVRSAYVTAVKNLQALRTEFETVQSTQKDLKDTPGPAVVLKNPVLLAIKSAVYGMILAGCASCAVLILLYLFSGKLQCVEDCGKEFGMPLLGLVRVSEKKRRKFQFIDSWIFLLRGGLYGRICYEEQVKITAANIQAAISEKSLKEGPKKIMFAGTLAEEEMDAVSKALASEIQSQSAIVSPYMQLVFHSSALRQLDTYDGVVFIEKRGASASKFIDQEKRSVFDRNVEVLGMIVIC